MTYVSQPMISPEAPMCVVVQCTPHVRAVRAEVPDEPRAQSTENPDDGGGTEEASVSRQAGEEAEEKRRHGVRDEVWPTAVQQRRPQDSPQPIGPQRLDAVLVEPAAVHRGVDRFDDIQQRDERKDRRAAELPGDRLLLLRNREAHANSSGTIVELLSAARPSPA